MIDYIIKNGIIIDGSGSPPMNPHIGISGDRICFVGKEGVFVNGSMAFRKGEYTPKIRFRILGKLTRRPKDKAAGDFATSHTITRMVRSKIAENAVFRDVLSV